MTVSRPVVQAVHHNPLCRIKIEDAGALVE